MERLFEIPGLNIYLQIGVTLLSIAIYFLATRGKPRPDNAITAVCTFVIGLSGWFALLSAVFGHMIYADQVAANIGWPMDSGFQMELGFAAAGIGLIGFLGFWVRSFWLPYIITRSIFLWGAGVTHILHLVRHGNFSPSNAGIVLYWDFILPVVLIALYSLYIRANRKEDALSPGA